MPRTIPSEMDSKQLISVFFAVLIAKSITGVYPQVLSAPSADPATQFVIGVLSPLAAVVSVWGLALEAMNS